MAARLAGVARWCDSVRSSGRKRCRKHVRYRANLDEAYTWVYGAAATPATVERRAWVFWPLGLATGYGS